MDDSIALVTGAAGGIGIAVARALGQRGVRVAAVDRDPEQLGRAVEELTAEGVKAAAFPIDVTRSADVEETVATVEREFGPLDHLVNAAGVLRLGEARELSDEDWNATFAVNATGVFHVSRAVVNRMAARGRGALVTVASNAATTPRTGMSAYAASKAAATMFTKSLGLEVARHGIRCNVVAPGSTDTPMLHSMWEDDSGPRGTIEGRADAFRVGIPLGRLAQPTQIAEAVVFLLSDEASHITLHTLTVDGGASLGG
ncbi:2,3-dihydro-2,3-dihydroxybenzoate dehydrogenase [Streptomyces sp. NPDC006879]|uniref:2,3-dihydro-2,3-dihydroxybenzoate dehydrogenase n=1 Tax=Streptomyces sp. NPDC006879 TaxID=3364767 RepID=UPI003688A5FD